MWRDRKRESTRSSFLKDIAFYENVPMLRKTIRNGRKKRADKSDEIQKSHDCKSKRVEEAHFHAGEFHEIYSRAPTQAEDASRFPLRAPKAPVPN